MASFCLCCHRFRKSNVNNNASSQTIVAYSGHFPCFLKLSRESRSFPLGWSRSMIMDNRVSRTIAHVQLRLALTLVGLFYSGGISLYVHTKRVGNRDTSKNSHDNESSYVCGVSQSCCTKKAPRPTRDILWQRTEIVERICVPKIGIAYNSR